MKRLIILLAAAAIAGGCQSRKPGPMPPASALAPSKSSQVRTDASLQQSLRDIQRSLDAASADQKQTGAKLTRAYDELRDTAVEIKAIKDRIDALQARQQTNDAAIGALQEKLKAAMDAAKAAGAQVSPGATAQLSDLQKQLDKEKKEKADALEASKKREQENEELRRTLAAQLKDSKKTIAADKTQPPVQAEPAGGGAYADATKWVAQGNNLLAEGKAEDAQALFEAALKARPAMVSALVGLAGCQYQRGDFLGATKSVERALDLDDRNAQALGIKGLVYRKSGSLSQATSALERAVKYDPQDARLRNYLGIVLTDRKRSADAIEQFRKAVELDPAYSEAHFNLAFLLATATPPKLVEAKGAYEKAISLGAERDADLEKLLGGAK